MLGTIDRDKLTGQDVYTYDIFAQNLQTNLDANRYPVHLLPVNQFIFSPHNFIVQLGSGGSAQPFNTAEDFDNFLQRLEGFAVWMDQAVVNMREGIKRGVVHNKNVVASMIPQLQAQIFDDIAQSPFFVPLHNAGEKLSDEEKDRITQAYRDVVGNKVIPAYARMAAFLEQDYLSKARDSYGFGDLPDGKAWYEFNILNNTTLPLTAEALHNTGLSEVKRIHGEMMKVAEQVGFEGDLQAFFDYLKRDPTFYFDSADQVIRAYEDLKQKVNPLLPKLFSVIPKADYVVRPYPEAQAKISARRFVHPGCGRRFATRCVFCQHL